MDLGVFFALSMFVIFMAMILIGYNVAFSFGVTGLAFSCLLYTSPSPRDRTRSRMPSSA